MDLDFILKNIDKMLAPQLQRVALAVARGFGFQKPVVVPAPQAQSIALRVDAKVTRRSTDNYFVTEEKWVLLFCTNSRASLAQLSTAVTTACDKATHAMVFHFPKMRSGDIDALHSRLANLSVRVRTLSFCVSLRTLIGCRALC